MANVHEYLADHREQLLAELIGEDHWHDSDESVLVDLLLAGSATLAALWPRLAALPT